MQDEHPFLSESKRRNRVIDLTLSFFKRNFNIEISNDRLRIGHLFFGKRAFPLSGRDIGFVFDGKAKYYPVCENMTVSSGIIILVDETGTGFDIGVSEIKNDELGIYFDETLLNVHISKNKNYDTSCFEKDEYYLELYNIDKNGILIRNENMDEILYGEKIINKDILNIILFNLNKFYCLN